ncbi:endonuclease/exonuclease/phosphatase family protein [Vibrio genomosp. F10]|uniref:endonuclease/exonuclease/phosphatase family protein n=1 Tax=Vibrio genomosp. F10 TaxID=723171 RepID=UPI0003806902|nr:endonuclease/exonuclease/phosphatase family protein [Vibrio genomosp. F10]OEF04292.1 hypothetical protein A1QK_10115 [Vibrio genomosp. F10 str. 9ZD137]
MASSERNIKVCTINLFNYVEPPNAFYDFANIYTKEEWTIKIRWLSQTITKIDADIIGFQEVFSIDSLRKTMHLLGYTHFVTVDTPEVEQDYIYSNPVVALASRHPVSQTLSINASSAIARSQSNFKFNRTPIHAVVDIPQLGPIDVYVVHLKSQRPTELDTQPDEERHDEPSTSERWLLESQGKWLSTVQRGMEVHVLHHHMIETKKQNERPCLLMGDFNQSLQSNEFHCLTSRHLFRLKESETALSAFHLHNSQDLVLEQTEITSTPTYYVGAQGKELDYILLSNEFSDCSDQARGIVTDYQVIDSHLVNPHYGHDHISTDHGIVTVNISII